MAERGYNQYCGAARALDLVGDRWTLLVVRELVFGPRRFTDLLDGLPGISRNLLTERLRTLERDGLITRDELPPPAARQVYTLTDDGRDLADALVPLVAWGARRLGARRPRESFRPQWAALAMATFADRDAATGVTETYQYVVGRTVFTSSSTMARSSSGAGTPRDPPSCSRPTRRPGPIWPRARPAARQRPPRARSSSLENATRSHASQ